MHWYSKAIVKNASDAVDYHDIIMTVSSFLEAHPTLIGLFMLAPIVGAIIVAVLIILLQYQPSR